MPTALFSVLSQSSLWQYSFTWVALKRRLSKLNEMTELTGQRENSPWVKCFYTDWAWPAPLPWWRRFSKPSAAPSTVPCHTNKR